MILGNVMVVDDDDITLDMLSHNLSQLIDGEVMTFSSSVMAKNFIQQADQDTFRLLICDLHMPKVDGFDLLTTLRKTHKDTPFLMLTGDATREAVLKAVQAGASDFIAKPFTSDDLTSKVHKLLKPNQ